MANSLKIVLGFGLTACLLSWCCWLPLALMGPEAVSASPLKYLHLAGGLGPAASALIWARIIGGKATLRTIAARIMLWRVPAIYQLIAWLGPFALLFAALAIAAVLGDQGAADNVKAPVEYPDLPLPVYWAAILLFYGFGEEIGWRGFALPVLQTHLDPARATLVVTVLWAIWHIPLFFFSAGMVSLGIGGTVGWLMSLVTGAFILTWLTNRARGSILIAAAFHATMDVAFGGSALVATIIGVSITVVGLLAAVAVIFRPTDAVVLKLQPQES